MKRRSLAYIALSLLLLCPQTFGNDAARKAVATVPSDALAFLCVPSLATLDADIQQLIKDLQLDAMIPAPMQSLVMNIKMNLPMLASIDENGPVCVVAMPFTVPAEIQSKVALVISTADPKAMITALGGEAEVNGVWPINLMGQSLFAIANEKSLILAHTAENAQAISQSKSNLSTKLSPDELNTFAGLDIILWANAKQALTTFKPQIDGLVAMFAMMQAQGGGPFAKQQADMTKGQVDIFTQGVKSLTIGISLDKAGLGLRSALTVNPGSALESQIKLANTKEPLLKGLPLGEYVFALGQQLHPEQTKAAMQQIDMYLDMASGIEGVSKDKLAELKEVITGIVTSLKSVSATLEALPPGDQGLVGATIVLGTSDAAKLVSLGNRKIAIGMEILGAFMKNTSEELPNLSDFVIHAPKAESGPAGPVSQIRVDLTKIDDVDDEDLAEMLKVIGKEGLVIRMAAANANHVVVTFGGGRPYFDRAMATAKSSNAPLAGDVGIKKVASHMPVSRAMVAYFALDHGMELVSNISMAVEGKPLPMPVPTVDAPIAITTSGGSGWAQYDLLFPMDLLIAAKNMGMAMNGMGAPPAAPAAQPGS